MPRPTWGDIKRFCERQGYDLKGTDHHDYVKIVSGMRSWTMVSHGAGDTTTVPPGLWKVIWSRQLRLRSEDDFWRGLQGEPCAYNVSLPDIELDPLPAYLVDHLRRICHFTDEQIAATARDDAQRMLDDYYSRDLAEWDGD